MTESCANFKSRRRNGRAHSPRVELLETRQLLNAGDLDLSFGNGGSVLTSPQSDPSETSPDFGNAVQIQSDGGIVVAGSAAGNDFGLIRLLPSGALDSSFGTGGRVVTDFFGNPSDSAADLAVQIDGKIIAVGLANAGSFRPNRSIYNNDFGVVRYLPNGTLDPTFGPAGNGKVNTDISTYSSTDGNNHRDEASAVALQGDGSVVVGGYSVSGTTGQDATLVRYDTSGNLDSTFGIGGKVVTAVGPGDDRIHDLTLLPDGRILVMGSVVDGTSHYSLFLAQYQANGQLDTTFGTAGTGISIISASPSLSLGGYGLALQPDGRILVAGLVDPLGGASVSSQADLAVVRLTSNGTLDTSFGGSGIVTLNRGNLDMARGIALQGDGSVVVGGVSRSTSGANDSLVARFLPDGSLDPSFGNGGVTVSSFSSGLHDEFNGLALQSDGSIVAVGEATVVTTVKHNQVNDMDFLVARYQGATTSLAVLSPSMASTQQVLPLNGEESAPLAWVSTGTPDLTQLGTESRPSRQRQRYVGAQG